MTDTSDNALRTSKERLLTDILAFLKQQQRAEEIALAALRQAGEGYFDGESVKAYNERVSLIERLESNAPETFVQPFKPYCRACQSVGMSHCSDPINCGNVVWEPPAKETFAPLCKHGFKADLCAQCQRDALKAFVPQGNEFGTFLRGLNDDAEARRDIEAEGDPENGDAQP